MPRTTEGNVDRIGKKAGQNSISEKSWWIIGAAILLLLVGIFLLFYLNTNNYSPAQTSDTKKSAIGQETQNEENINSEYSNGFDSNVVTGIAIRGLDVREALTYGMEPEKNVAYVMRYKAMHDIDMISINSIVHQSKLSDFAITVDGKKMIDGFRIETTGSKNILTVNTFLPEENGDIKILTWAGDGTTWSKLGGIDQIKGPQRNIIISKIERDTNNEYYKMQIDIKIL